MDGARMMADGDILIPPGEETRAIEIAGTLGWRPQGRLTEVTPSHLSVTHAVTVVRRGHASVDLHSRLLASCLDATLTRVLQENAIPVAVQHVKTESPHPTHQLMHACIHGFAWNSVPPIRWIADAVTILRASEIDWDLLLSTADRYRLSAELLPTLSLLRDLQIVPIAESVLTRLRCVPVPRAKRRYLRTFRRPVAVPLAGLPRLWAAHRLRECHLGRRSLLTHILRLPGYARAVLGWRTYGQLACWALTQGVRRSYRLLRRSLESVDRRAHGSRAPEASRSGQTPLRNAGASARAGAGAPCSRSPPAGRTQR